MGFVSIFDIFSTVIGPSSSHTAGPMRAARRFVIELKEREFLEDVSSFKVELYGSLAMTGKGHATDIAVLLGLEGETPEGVDPGSIQHRIAAIHAQKTLQVFGRYKIQFDSDTDLLFLKGKRLPFHSNAMRMRAYDKMGRQLYSQLYYSIGGGFVLDHEEAIQTASPQVESSIPFPFHTAEQLFKTAKRENKAIWQIVLENEKKFRTEEQIVAGIFRIWSVMQESVERGLSTSGELPGGLKVQRRAALIYQELSASPEKLAEDPTLVMEWVSVYALAVNEENAAGSRVVTAPTNGSAGVIPAVLHYAKKFVSSFSDETLVAFFLTASAIALQRRSFPLRCRNGLSGRDRRLIFHGGSRAGRYAGSQFRADRTSR